ncbi:MAG: hypothetical protein KDA32_02985 [Phycisphaerales bacterium]|nr:hypothetical protein [Phycisphaerales bacterium]
MRGRIGFITLARYRLIQLRNLIDQQLQTAPARTLLVLTVLIVIWGALHYLFRRVMMHIEEWDIVGVVANKHLFMHFFLVLGVMLGFSNALLMFGSLFGRDEAAHLLATPAHPRAIVLLKWLEGVFLSSWSFMLLGVPLMFAVGSSANVGWYFYPLFLAHFVAFTITPACLGLLAAWSVAMWAPRKPLTVAIGVGGGLTLAGLWLIRRLAARTQGVGQWLNGVFGELGVVDHPFLPTNWTARGVITAIRHDPENSVFFGFVVLANAVFLSWAVVNLIAKTLPTAYSRAQAGRFSPTIRHAWITAALCWPLRLIVPRAWAILMLKDLRTFTRDTKQWTQMLIMFGLLLIYVANLQRLPFDLENVRLKGVIAFLNLAIVSLILATFTSRFVYPLLSLETQQIWLLNSLPVRRFDLLFVKFIFATSITVVSAVGVMGLAVYVLDLSPVWARINIAVCFGICIGLSGLAIGLGARFPVLAQRNPARIAAGFGGTLNLVISMLFVIVVLGAISIVFWREVDRNLPDRLQPISIYMLVVTLAFCVVTAIGAMIIGAGHLRRLEV